MKAGTRFGTTSPHGTYARYSSRRYPCRCRPCVAANAEYTRQKRAEARARLAAGVTVVDGIKHGYSGYQNHYCRCAVCCAAKAAFDRARWAS